MRQYRLLSLFVIIYWVGHIHGSSVNIREASTATEELRKHFNKINQDDDDSTGLIFLKLFDSWKEEGEKKILLSQIVPVYLKMLDAIPKIPELQASIKNLKMMLHTSFEDLLKQSDQKLRGLHELKKIQVGDVKTQHAAIKELFMILRELSVMEQPKNHVVKKRKLDFQQRNRKRRNRLF
ncbi:interferon gamma [Xenopus tropicalis]|eukprot:XP_002938555.1 PREDICTED: interferon gamma [Xenopus tropicalis]